MSSFQDKGTETKVIGQVQVTPRPAIFAAAILAVLATIATRTGLIHGSPEFDELYHLLAARGWLETGRFAILDGEYTRGGAYTWLVAKLFAITGSDSLATGRLVSVAMSALLVPVIVIWARAHAGWVAAGFALIFVILWPRGIIEAQLLRFYSFHTLSFAFGAICVYQASLARRSAQPVWAVLAVAALFLAVKLQIITVIGVLGICVWLYFLILLSLPLSNRQRAYALGGTVLMCLGVLGAAQMTGLLQKAWAIYRWVPDHALEQLNYAGFYHRQMALIYPVMWALTPLLLVLALLRNARLTLFCLCIYVTSFFVHSFGGMKFLRYLSYSTPFLFVIWGLGLAQVVGFAQARLGRPAGYAIGAVLLALILATDGAPRRAFALATGTFPADRGDWSELADLAGDWVDDAAYVVTTRELHTTVILGRYDLLYNDGRLSELPGGQDFVVDFRTGRPVIGSPAAFGAVLACHPMGLFITGILQWDRQGHAAQLEPVLAEHGLTTEIRRGDRVVVLHWRDPENRPPDCSGIPVG